MQQAIKPIQETLQRYIYLKDEHEEASEKYREIERNKLKAISKQKHVQNRQNLSILFKFQSNTFPVIPDEIFDAALKEYNELRAKGAIFPFLLEKFKGIKRSQAEKSINKLVDEFEPRNIDNAESADRKLATIEADIATIEKSNNNGIPFTKFEEILKEKEKMIAVWKRLKGAREEEIVARNKTKPSSGNKNIKPSVIDPVEDLNKNLGNWFAAFFEKFPDFEMFENKDVQVVLTRMATRGDEFWEEAEPVLNKEEEDKLIKELKAPQKSNKESVEQKK